MIIIGSRGSSLALAQATWAKRQIQNCFPDVEVAVEIIKTLGDKDVISSLRTPSTAGVFVKEIEQALLDGKIDIAVHSMKDLPAEIPAGLHIAAVPEREDTRDALVTNSPGNLSQLPDGARIGTGSLRRQAQILSLRPDLNVMDIRGNLDTRLKKLRDGDYDAIILACAGLRRLGLQNQISSILEHSQMLPAPGQGALAIETRTGDSRIEAIASELNHPPTALAVFAERSFLQNMGGGCNVPVGVHGYVEQNMIQMDALVATPDGQRAVRDSIRLEVERSKEAVAILSQRILSRGGREILNETPHATKV